MGPPPGQAGSVSISRDELSSFEAARGSMARETTWHTRESRILGGSARLRTARWDVVANGKNDELQSTSGTMNGILTHAQIDGLLNEGHIVTAASIDQEQRQPASLDLRLGHEALAIRAGFLPTGRVEEQVESLVVDRVSLTNGAVLRRNQVYLVKLLEGLALPEHISARANPRSSTGRIDVFTRTVVDGHDRFDDVPAGYTGPLWLEVVPRSFDVRVTTGQRLNQIRFFVGDPILGDDELAERLETDDLVPDGTPADMHDGSLLLGLSLRADVEGAPIGWRARDDAPVLDLANVGGHPAGEFFVPVHTSGDGTLILKPEGFYILASSERVRVPGDLAAEMLPYDVGMGELRTNYAGFFDSGFGWGPGSPHGSRAVLEVRPHDVPFRVEHRQPIFRLQYSRTVEPCRELYGSNGSAYQNQGLRLARYFSTND